MALVIADSIRKKEFKRGEIPKEDFAVLQRSARLDLTTTIKGSDLPDGTALLKAYATATGGARRIVYLLSVEDETLFLLFYRDKNDILGKNISVKNSAFKKSLHRYLDLLLSDISTGSFEVFDTE